MLCISVLFIDVVNGEDEDEVESTEERLGKDKM
jgi:hypothetical protein